jgi:hypothetical protein
MATASLQEVTRLLWAWSAGNEAAHEALIPLISIRKLEPGPFPGWAKAPEW